jgi:hypothetical protein
MRTPPKSISCESCGGPACPPLQHAAPALCRHCHVRYFHRPEGDDVVPELNGYAVHSNRGNLVAREDGDGAAGYPTLSDPA